MIYLPAICVVTLVIPFICHDSTAAVITPQNFTLDPNANKLIFSRGKYIENVAIAAFIATILIISCFILKEIKKYNQLTEYVLSPRVVLKSLKLKNANKIIMGHLNINSLRNKFESLKYIVDKNVDILLISETKLNDTYPSSQFLIEGFHPPYRKDHTEQGND